MPSAGRRAVLGGAAAVLLAPRAASALPVDTSAGPCVVSVSLGGRPARMILDTGSEKTILTRAAVARLQLPLDEWVGTALRGAGGRLDEHRNAVVRSLSLGDIALYPRGPSEAFSLPVAALDLGDIVGLLGGDLLRRHTLDLDLPAGVLRLGDAVPAGADWVRVQVLRRALPLAPVRLDGRELTALIDTGASVSLLNARGLHRMGLAEADLSADPTVSSAGIGGRFSTRQHRFSMLRIGRVSIPGPALLTVATPEPAFDMVVGLDVLARQRMVLSYAGARLALG